MPRVFPRILLSLPFPITPEDRCKPRVFSLQNKEEGCSITALDGVWMWQKKTETCWHMHTICMCNERCRSFDTIKTSCPYRTCQSILGEAGESGMISCGRLLSSSVSHTPSNVSFLLFSVLQFGSSPTSSLKKNVNMVNPNSMLWVGTCSMYVGMVSIETYLLVDISFQCVCLLSARGSSKVGKNTTQWGRMGIVQHLKKIS